MLKFVLVGTVAALASANHHTKVHPINVDIIEEIKAKADTWQPLELIENPL